MKRTIRLQLGKSSDYLFEEVFDTDDKTSTKDVMRKYLELFQRYKETHSISSRRWRFPVVLFKDGDGEFYPKYRITPNGSWDEIYC